MLETTVEIKKGSDFPALAPDKYHVVILDVELETRMNKFIGEEQEKLKYTMAIIDDKEIPESKETTQGRRLWLRATPSSHQKSWYYKLCSSIFSDIDSNKCAAINPNDLVGCQVDCLVDAKPATDGSGRVFNNITSLSKVRKPLSRAELEKFFVTIQFEAEEYHLNKADGTKAVSGNDAPPEL